MELTTGRPFPLKHRAKMYFSKAVSNDTFFLSIISVVDYSILVGFDEDKHEIVVGIIDYMRQYDIVKRMERMGKSVGMLTGQAEPTIIQPPMYKKRFNAAMERYFMDIPDKWVSHELI
jgi:1-phosphatidylinositol-3-phosphate 5-kinase